MVDDVTGAFNLEATQLTVLHAHVSKAHISARLVPDSWMSIKAQVHFDNTLLHLTATAPSYLIHRLFSSHSYCVLTHQVRAVAVDKTLPEPPGMLQSALLHVLCPPPSTQAPE